MAGERPQSFANHARWVPPYHFVMGPILLVNAVWSIFVLARPPALATVMRRAGRDPSSLAPVAVAARAAARRFSVQACGWRIITHLQQVAAQGRSATLRDP